jgi:hypothetical protein
MPTTRFLYDAAERRARQAGIQVVSACHASLPPGTPCRDGHGNYVTAETIYVGIPGTAEKDCAYGRCIHSIHDVSSPSVSSALHDIAEALLVLRTFADRAAYEAYYRAGCRTAADHDSMAVAWRDYSNTAHRAIRCLPAELLAWLDSPACCV